METAYFLVDTEQIGNLDELMARQSVDDEKYIESVSWFDAVTTGPHLGRGILTRANHATVDDLPPRSGEAPAQVRRAAAADRPERVPARPAQQADRPDLQ